MDPKRKQWNEGHHALREALLQPDRHAEAVALFLSQHAMLHAAAMTGSNQPTFEDEIWQGLSDDQARAEPGADAAGGHSIAWVLWHSARIEDVTMNVLLADAPQRLLCEDWPERLGVPFRDTGNLMNPAGKARFNATIDITALRAYRMAVGRRTRQVVQAVSPDALRRKIEPARLQRVLDEGAVIPAAMDLIHYWGGLTGARLLLMPPTRHSLVHLNEAKQIREQLQRSRRR